MLFLGTAILLLRGFLAVVCQLFVQSRLFHLGRRLCVAQTSAGENTKALLADKLANEGLAKVQLLQASPMQTKESFGAYFDPKANLIALPTDIYFSRSYESLAIGAHEVGHALQQRSLERFERVSHFLMCVDVFQLAGVGYGLGFFALIGGVSFEIPVVILVASITLILALALEMVGVLLEYDASRRAKQVILRSGGLQSEEIGDVTILLDALSISCFGGIFATIAGFIIGQFYVGKERGYEAVTEG